MRSLNRDELMRECIAYIKDKKMTPERASQWLRDFAWDVLEEIAEELPGSYVFKKKGLVEPYDREKLLNSVAAASDHCSMPMTKGDLHLILRDVENLLEGYNRELIPTTLLREFVMESLKKEGFGNIAHCYSSH